MGHKRSKVRLHTVKKKTTHKRVRKVKRHERDLAGRKVTRRWRQTLTPVNLKHMRKKTTNTVENDLVEDRRLSYIKALVWTWNPIPTYACRRHLIMQDAGCNVAPTRWNEFYRRSFMGRVGGSSPPLWGWVGPKVLRLFRTPLFRTISIKNSCKTSISNSFSHFCFFIHARYS